MNLIKFLKIKLVISNVRDYYKVLYIMLSLCLIIIKTDSKIFKNYLSFKWASSALCNISTICKITDSACFS